MTAAMMSSPPLGVAHAVSQCSCLALAACWHSQSGLVLDVVVCLECMLSVTALPKPASFVSCTSARASSLQQQSSNAYFLPSSPNSCNCRSELGGSSPESSDSRPLSPLAETNGKPSLPGQMPEASLQSSPQQIAIQPEQGIEGPELPPSPFEQMAHGTAVAQMPSQPMSISSPSRQPASFHSPVSSSAPADSRQHVHRWAGLSRQGSHHASVHQLPQASPAGQHEQASSSAAAGGKGSQPAAPRPSALHATSSSSSKGKSDGRGDGGHSIPWNDSRDSLWSSQEDLAQLVPDRASKDGVEQSPEAVSFTGYHLCYLHRPHPDKCNLNSCNHHQC